MSLTEKTLISGALEIVSDFCNYRLHFLDLIDTRISIGIIEELKRKSLYDVKITMSNSTTVVTTSNTDQGAQTLTIVISFAIGGPIVIVVLLLTIMTMFVRFRNLL